MIGKLSAKLSILLPSFTKLEIALSDSEQDLLFDRIQKLYESKKWNVQMKAYESLFFGLGGGAVSLGANFMKGDSKKFASAIGKIFPFLKDVAVSFTEASGVTIEAKLATEKDHILPHAMSTEKEMGDVKQRLASQANTEADIRAQIMQAIRN